MFIVLSLHIMCIAAWGKDIRISLVDAIKSALAHNEVVTKSIYRIAEAEASVTTAKSPYDTTAYTNVRRSAFNNLSANSLSTPSNATRSYNQSDVGVRQRVPTGGSLAAYYTHNIDERLGYAGGSKTGTKNYITLEFTQSLLRGLGDSEQRGAIEKALLSVENRQLERELLVSQVVLEVIRTYWGLVLSQESLAVGKEITAMAREVLRKEKARLKEGLSRGVDVDRAFLAVKQREYTVLQQERDVAIARERLQFILNEPRARTGAQLNPAAALTDVSKNLVIPSAIDTKALAIQRRIEIKQITLLLKQIRIDLSTAKNMLLPYLDVSTGVTSSYANTYLRSGENFRDTDKSGSWFVGLSFNYPLQNSEARGNLDKQTQLMRITNEQLNRTFRQIAEQVQESLHNLTIAKQSIPVAREALNAAERTLRGEMERFEMGVVNNRDLLISHDALGREKISYLTSLANFRITQAEFEFATAALLQKYTITVDKKQIGMP